MKIGKILVILVSLLAVVGVGYSVLAPKYYLEGYCLELIDNDGKTLRTTNQDSFWVVLSKEDLNIFWDSHILDVHYCDSWGDIDFLDSKTKVGVIKVQRNGVDGSTVYYETVMGLTLEKHQAKILLDHFRDFKQKGWLNSW